MHEPATIYIYLSTNGPLFRFQMDYSTSNSNVVVYSISSVNVVSIKEELCLHR